MGLPSPRYVAAQVVQHLTRHSNDLTWHKIDDVIRAILYVHVPNISIERREEFADKIRDNVETELRNDLAEAERDGRHSLFDLSDDAYVRIRDQDVVVVKRRLCELSPGDFEEFCRDVLSTLGGRATVQGGPSDGGIDFDCFDLRSLPTDLPTPISLNLVVLGQAKRYADTNIITTKMLREFVGAAVLRHHDLLISGSLSARQPVLFAFWTTSSFDNNAREFARKVGIWIMDGVTLARYAQHLALPIATPSSTTAPSNHN